MATQVDTSAQALIKLTPGEESDEGLEARRGGTPEKALDPVVYNSPMHRKCAMHPCTTAWHGISVCSFLTLFSV
jgi:hypothetical protein